MKLIDFYKNILKEEIPEVLDTDIIEPEKPDEIEKPAEDEAKFIDTVETGFDNFGCSFLFKIKRKEETKLSELRKSKTDPEWQIQLIEHIEYVDSRILEESCVEKPAEPTTDTIKPFIDTTKTIYAEPTKGDESSKSIASIQQDYEAPKVLPEPIYGLESEISNITQTQTDELIDNAIIDLDNQILLQRPEIQEKLKELNITSERMAYVLPLTKETKDFMMGMQMKGIKLPHLMVMYNNVKTLYPAIEKGVNVDTKRIQPLNNVINYNEFWDWARLLWKNSRGWVKSNFLGTYPELDESTLLP